jgi:hypothetical protein
MKTTIAIFATSLVFGQAAFAEVSTQSIIDDLSGQGFSTIEIVTGLSQVKAEARNGSTKIEVIYDRETGQILKQEQSRVRAGEELTQGVSVRTRAENFLGDDDLNDDANDDATDDMSDDEGDDDHGAGDHGDDDHGGDDHDDGGHDDGGDDDSSDD